MATVAVTKIRNNINAHVESKSVTIINTLRTMGMVTQTFF